MNSLPILHGQQTKKTLSETFLSVTEWHGDEISLKEIIEHFGDRAFGALILFFAAPNMLPLPPGTSSVLSAPLIFITVQLVMGRSTIWLPEFMVSKKLKTEHVKFFCDKVAELLKRTEVLVKPRYLVMTKPIMERLIGIIALVLSVVLFLPIPLGNLPPAVALSLFSVGIIERDGIFVALGWLATLISFGILIALGFAAVAAYAQLT